MKFLNTKTLMAGVALSVGVWIGCAPVKFSKDENFIRCQNFTEDCKKINDRDYFDYNFSITGGLVDILFVNDNSASMSEEQRHMAERFGSFLDQVKILDYRIGMITTDVSASPNNPPREINKSGLLQDGNLIEFAAGIKYLVPQTPDKEILFANTIKRPETLQCEQWLLANYNSNTDRTKPEYTSPYLANCPSMDERGIYATNMLVTKNSDGFLRPNAHFAVIMISDEDERSQGENAEKMGTTFALDNMDRPQSLIDKVKQNFNNEKTLSAHSIIIKPGDTSCREKQNAQMAGRVNGFEGKLLADLAALTNGLAVKPSSNYDARESQGIIGDICANDYGAQLGEIGSTIVNKIREVPLACETPANLKVTLTPNKKNISYTQVGAKLIFSDTLPMGETLNLKYNCKSLW